MIKWPRNVSHKNQEFYLTKLNIIKEKLGNLISTCLSSLLEEFPQIQATQRSRSRSLSGALLSGYGSKSLTLKSWYDQTWLSRLSVWFDWFVQPKNHTLFRLNSKNQHVQYSLRMMLWSTNRKISPCSMIANRRTHHCTRTSCQSNTEEWLGTISELFLPSHRCICTLQHHNSRRIWCLHHTSSYSRAELKSIESMLSWLN